MKDMVAKKDLKGGNTTYYTTKKGRRIGTVYYTPKWKWWGFSSDRMERKSGGLSGGNGIDTEKEAIELMLRADEDYK